MKRLNYFHPFDRKDPGEEDPLTRAFLVLVRHIPLVRSFLLELIRERQREAGYKQVVHRLSEITEEIQVETQTAHLDEDQRRWLVPVLISPDRYEFDGPVDDRSGVVVYDGVLTLPEHIVTVEAKIRQGAVDPSQLGPSVSADSEVRREKSRLPISVSWREIHGLLAGLRDRCSPSGQRLVDDYLEFVKDHYDRLSPFTRFAICGESQYLLGRRCEQVLEVLGEPGLVGEGSGYLKLNRDPVGADRILLRPKPSEGSPEVIQLDCYPGIRAPHAHVFYDRVNLEQVSELGKEEGWSVEPNLEFRYQGSKEVTVPSRLDTLSLEDYLKYWIERHSDLVGRVPGKDRMREVVQQLRRDGQLEDQEVERVQEEFLETQRDFFDLCPAVAFRRRWPISEARRLDDGDLRFVKVVRSAAERVLGLWDQPLPYGA